MSNTSILQRLEDKFEDFLQNRTDKYQFTAFLNNSIDALEGIDYETIQIAKGFQYKFEVAEFSDEDPEIEDIEKVTNDFREWLQTLRQENYR